MAKKQKVSGIKVGKVNLKLLALMVAGLALAVVELVYYV